VTAALLLLSVIASKTSGRLGVPALLVFIAIGMLAGSEVPGGIAFDDPWLAQSLGVVALALILASLVGMILSRREDPSCSVARTTSSSAASAPARPWAT
jgi:NhaP-type Na+/H+ and K+/H+ antiporter